jgi:magnesium transporter
LAAKIKYDIINLKIQNSKIQNSMITYKKNSSNISEIIIKNSRSKNTIKWTNVVSAGNKEIDYLQKNYSFNMAHLDAAIATVFSQRPMISEEKKYFFIILHFPVLVNGKIITGEIEFFIGHGYLITVHNNNIPTLNSYFDKLKNKETSENEINSSIILLYKLLKRLIDSCYFLIDNTSTEINRVENLIYSTHSKEAVKLILNLRRNIINLRKIMQNHKYILGKLTEVKSSLVPSSEIKFHYNELIDHSERIWAMLDNQKEMIEVLNSTNQSLLDNEMNKIIKTLTIFSVIIFPLTLLATLFSMSVPGIPFAHNPYGFWLVLLVTTVVGLGMAYYFMRKKWL